MIKAVIFDCFDVLVESSYKRFYRTYLSEKPEIVAEIQKLDEASCRGEMTQEDFYAGVAKLSNMETAEVRTQMRSSPVNIDLLEYIGSHLKPEYKVGFLSNVATDRMNELFTDEQQQLFDDVVLSYKVGLAKPDEKIFQLAATRLGVQPSECIFVDDSQRYVDGALMAGMESILFTSTAGFQSGLKTLLKSE